MNNVISNTLFTEKYRPKNIEEVILPKRIKTKLSNGVYQHLLFYSSPGTGKCLVGDTSITIKNKTTNEVEVLTMGEFHSRFPGQV